MRLLTGSISTYVFSIRDGAPVFLALLRAPGLPHAGTWQAVHGMIEPGEAAYAAAEREAIEETGLQPERFFTLDFVETFYSKRTDAIHLVPTFAAFVAGSAPAVISDEHTDAAWCDLDETLRRFIWPNQREAVRIIAAAVSNWPDVTHDLSEISAPS